MKKDNHREPSSMKLSVTPTTHKNVTSLIRGHQTQDDIVNEMYSLYIRIKHIKVLEVEPHE